MHGDATWAHDGDVVGAGIAALCALVARRLFAIAFDLAAPTAVARPFAGLVAFRVRAQGALELQGRGGVLLGCCACCGDAEVVGGGWSAAGTGEGGESRPPPDEGERVEGEATSPKAVGEVTSPNTVGEVDKAADDMTQVKFTGCDAQLLRAGWAACREGGLDGGASYSSTSGGSVASAAETMTKATRMSKV